MSLAPPPPRSSHVMPGPPDESPLPPQPEIRRDPLWMIGDVVRFSLHAIGQIRKLGPMWPEVLRQAGLIITGSIAVLLAISFLSGGSCGLEMNVIARTFGISPLAGGFVFGYIRAAKVGCGMVAELGAMQVAEEVDALDVMAVRSVRFLVTTRMVGAAIALPIAFVLCMGAAGLASWLQIVSRFGDVSGGTYDFIFFSWFRTSEMIIIALKGLLMIVFVICTSLYYGYHVRGGPVDVGLATARSMAVNLIGITFINTGITLIFWGANPNQPFG